MTKRRGGALHQRKNRPAAQFLLAARNRNRQFHRGAGFALILNELSVFLAFDTFYLDMTQRDPGMIFDVEKLYHRTESEWAVALALAVLLMLTFLYRFFRRSLFVVRARLRGKDS